MKSDLTCVFQGLEKSGAIFISGAPVARCLPFLKGIAFASCRGEH